MLENINGIEIKVNVYNLSKLNIFLKCIGLGAYHTVKLSYVVKINIRQYKFGILNFHL